MLRKFKICLILSSFSLVMSACSSWQPGSKLQDNASGLASTEACGEPRSLKCTREYRPVCAIFNDGSISQFANACTACSNHEVSAYQLGVCPIKQK